MQTKAPSSHGFPQFFHRFAQLTAAYVGSSWAFVIGVVTVIVWAATGSYFHYSDTWQLVINTGTTIVTFLMVFLIQHTQNRDAKITQMKLDELLRAVSEARTDLIEMEKLPDEELSHVERQLHRARERAIQEKDRRVARRKAGPAQQNGSKAKKGQ